MRKRFPNPHRSRGLLALTLLTCLAAMCVMEHAGAERKVKVPKANRRSESHEIEALEAQWRAAIVKGDTSAMDKLLADDFLGISARGTLSDKQQYLHRMAIHATQFSALDLLDLKVQIRSGTAVAVSQARVTGMLEGHPIEGSFRYTKVFTRAANGDWRITNFEATRVSAASTPANDEGMMTGQRPPHHGWQ